MIINKRAGILTLRIFVVLLFSSAFFWRCANVVAPQGGPKDSLPPRIMAANPQFDATNFNSKKVTITFDEYIQLKDQQKEFFSSPMMKKNPTLTIKGRSVVVDIKDTLAPNTTYALNFGSAIRDNNEGNPLNGFRYVFSTGPEIDSMYMSGYTVDAYKKDSTSKTLIFFYEAAVDSVPQYDSLLFNHKPVAIARAENNGIFIAQNLKPIDYRVYAIEDKNNNFTYEPGTDKVAFLDGTFNPADLPAFDAWFDTTRNYLSADPQLYFRMFADKQFKRQNLVESSRPGKHQLQLMFNAPYPQIDSLTIEGVDASEIITEYLSKGRDTMNLWLNLPGEGLPDTIKGRIVYMRHDSVNNLVPYGQNLRLPWKYVESKEERRERERAEKAMAKALADSTEYVPKPKPNTFKFSSNIKKEINPEKNIEYIFDQPLVSIDSARISLIRLEDDRQFRVKYALEQDSANMHKWTISAPWVIGNKYRLEVPAGVFRNVAGEQNDSLKSDFSILAQDKFGKLIINVKGKNDKSSYVLQLLSARGSVLQEKRHARSGTYEFNYIDPGEVKFRIIEDSNDNGIWDSGDLVNRIQPERVELYLPESGNELIAIKANWEIELDVDMAYLFRPVEIDDIRIQIDKAERVRAQRIIEERAKKKK